LAHITELWEIERTIIILFRVGPPAAAEAGEFGVENLHKIILLSKRVRKEVSFGFDCLVMVIESCGNVWFGSGKWFYSCIFLWFAEAGKKCSKAVHLLEKSVINVI